MLDEDNREIWVDDLMLCDLIADTINESAGGDIEVCLGELGATIEVQWFLDTGRSRSRSTTYR